MTASLAEDLCRELDDSVDAWVSLSFIGFCERLGVELTDAQRVACKVAFDRVQPGKLKGEERKLARVLFGDVDIIPAEAFATVVAVCGGRGGKSYVLIALRLLWGMLTRDLSPLRPGQKAIAPVVAPNDELRQEVINYALGAAWSHPELRARLVLPKGATVDSSPSWFGIKRRGAPMVRMTGIVATRGGYGGRGRWLTDAALDESAFFRDASFKVNDKDLYASMSARVLPGGQTIVASTPWARSGLLYELHTANHGKPDTALSIHAPTLLFNGSAVNKAIVAREIKRDPDNAEREFFAKFMSANTTDFFAADLIESCLVDTIEPWQLGDELSAGGDFGFRTDSSALLLAWRRQGMMYVGAPLELRPEPGKPLKPSETVKAFAAAINSRCSYLMADGHYRESIAEHLEVAGLAFAAAPTQTADPYVRLRTLMREGKIKILRHSRLVQQMLEVQSRALSGGGLSIAHPRWRTGGHGDLVAALVLATWQHAGEVVKRDAEKLPDDFEERLKTHQEQAERPGWQKRPGRGERAPWRQRTA